MSIEISNAYYLRPKTRLPRLFWLCIIFTAAIAAFVGVQAYRQYQRAEKAILVNLQLLANNAKAVVPPPSMVDIDIQKKWTALKVEREFNWEPLFKAIEKSSTKEIELLEFLPEKNNRLIVLRGEAKSHQALITFLEALALQTSLDKVHLAHQQMMSHEKIVTISFEVKATLLALSH